MIRFASIRAEVAAVYGLDPGALLLPDNIRHSTKETDETEARHVTAFLARRVTNLSRRQIADRLGYRDATSAIFAEKRIMNRLTDDDELRTRVARVLAKLVMAEVRAPLGAPSTAAPALLASLQPANEAHPQ